MVPAAKAPHEARPTANAIAFSSLATPSGSTVASVFAAGELDARIAVIGILVALSTNTLTKIGLAFQSGPRIYGVRVLVGLLIVLAAAWAGFALQSFLF